MQFFPNQEKLKFEPVEHVYKYEDTELISVSTLIKKYSHPFDQDGSILAKKAAENGVSIKDQKAEWEKKGKDAREKGTLFHSDIENYIHTKKIPNNINKKLVKQFSKIKFEGLLFSEVRLFNLKYNIAGTTDLIEILPDYSLSLLDYKTNAKKKMSRFSFGRKMFYPLNSIWDSVLDKFEIQISIYAYMLEEAGWWVRNLTILHIDYENEKLVKISMRNRRQDVINMLNHYKKNCAHL